MNETVNSADASVGFRCCYPMFIFLPLCNADESTFEAFLNTTNPSRDLVKLISLNHDDISLDSMETVDQYASRLLTFYARRNHTTMRLHGIDVRLVEGNEPRLLKCLQVR